MSKQTEEMAETDEIGLKELYTLLKERAGGITFSMQDLLVRLRDGIKRDHSNNILCLFWWHLYTTDRTLYERLKSSRDEAEMRQILGGKVMTGYNQGEKNITICSDLFPPQFLQIVDAYIDYTDELSRQ